VILRLRVLLLVIVTLTLQVVVLSGLRESGIRTDALLLLPIVAAIVGGSERGAIVGFVAGFVADLFLQTPFGLSALTFSVVGFAVGVLQGNVIRAAWWIAPLTALVGSAVGIVLYAVIGAVVGQGHLMRPELAVIAVSVALVNAPLSIVAVRLMSWALREANPDRAYAR
jgi:rod shape-determining protein MreD